MKKLVILTVTLLMVSVASYPQESKNNANNESRKEKRIEKRGDRRELKILKGNKVSDIAMRNFKVDFAKAIDPKWVRTPNYDLVTFKLKKRELKAYYDSDGSLVGTLENKTIDDLPDKGVKILQTKYKNYSIGTILYFDNNASNNSPMLLYGTEIEDESSFFVELAKDGKKLIVYVDPGGNVKPFKQL